ncbi:MAG: hypothetical protein UHS49_04470, partial [Faecalimonas sp.]|nr:hypothetical protein [Faecalimonas sp.]
CKIASKPHRDSEGSKMRAFTSSFFVICNLRAISRDTFSKKQLTKRCLSKHDVSQNRGARKILAQDCGKSKRLHLKMLFDNRSPNSHSSNSDERLSIFQSEVARLSIQSFEDFLCISIL